MREFLYPLRIALSVLCIVGSTKVIKHFKIKEDTGVGGFFITPSRSFSKLGKLVDYYRGKQHTVALLFIENVKRDTP